MGNFGKWLEKKSPELLKEGLSTSATSRVEKGVSKFESIISSLRNPDNRVQVWTELLGAILPVYHQSEKNASRAFNRIKGEISQALQAIAATNPPTDATSLDIYGGKGTGTQTDATSLDIYGGKGTGTQTAGKPAR